MLKLIAEGYTHKEIADILGISVKTAVAHQTNLSEKINLHSRAALIRFAIQKGIIKIDAGPCISQPKLLACFFPLSVLRFF